MARPDEALIVALWADRPSYDHFMDQAHDPLVDHSGQGQTYDRIRITITDINGRRSAGWLARLDLAQFATVTETEAGPNGSMGVLDLAEGDERQIVKLWSHRPDDERAELLVLEPSWTVVASS